MFEILTAIICFIIIVLRPYSLKFSSGSMINYSLLFMYLELVPTYNSSISNQNGKLNP